MTAHGDGMGHWEEAGGGGVDGVEVVEVVEEESLRRDPGRATPRKIDARCPLYAIIFRCL